jgi:VIT1/CCC1 family predicted Fe2+/Mn2+ transporter
MMGFQDGLVSIGGLVSGLGGAGAQVVVPSSIGALAAAISMAFGELTSVATAKDAGESSREQPWEAARQSFVAFLVGSAVPIAAYAATHSFLVLLLATGAGMYVASRSLEAKQPWRNVVLALVALLISRGVGRMVPI